MSDKLDIIILMNALDMGGAEKQSLLLAKAIGNDYRVHYVVQKNEPRLKQHLDFIERERINYVQLSGSFLARLWQLRSYVRQNDVRLLIAMLTLDNAMAACISLLTGIKCIGGVRSSYLPFQKLFVTWIAEKFFLDHIIYNNNYGRNLFVKKGFSGRKSSVIHNCINNIQKEIKRPRREKITILSVGRFTFEKDYLTALKAISILNKICSDKVIDYIIIGDGECLDLINGWINNLKLGNVSLVINPESVEAFYLTADIYLMSSISEGMPNSIMEAFSYSLPVVTTDAGDATFLVEDNVSGYVVPQKDYQAMAEKLADLVMHYEKRITFGLHGHKHVLNTCTEDIFRQRYLDLINKLLNS
jgi:glycosyltransferase involved in cell wall biosynthesis